MKQLKDQIGRYVKIFGEIKRGVTTNVFSLPNNTYFIEHDEVISIPRDDGDNRYPYGMDGFNFWAYASGYMHSNEGLFSPFLRSGEGQEPNIAFFAGLRNQKSSFDVLPLLSVPIIKDCGICAERFTVFAKSSVYYITETKDLRFSVRVFVDKEKTTCFTIFIENLSGEAQKFFISAYLNPFLAHAINENGEHRWFRESKYLAAQSDDGLGKFIIKTNEDISRTLSVSNYGIIDRKITLKGDRKFIEHEETTSRYQYVGGSRSSLHTPAALVKGTFGVPKHICAFTEVGIMGDIVHLDLTKGETIRYDISLSFLVNCHDDSKVESYIDHKSVLNINDIDEKLGALEQYEAKSKSDLTFFIVSMDDKYNKYNPFLEYLKKQVEFCSLIKGYIQLAENSLIGIRDVFQAIEGMVFFNPGLARNKMLEALNFLSPDGRCPRQYSLPANEGAMPIMDLRPFIDQGAWVVSTIVTYLKFTGDFDFLNEQCGYYEILDDKKRTVKKSDLYESVLDHMIKIMDYLINNRDLEQTNCIRALYGDWNDALDGLGVSLEPGKEYGTGVSVMATLQVYQNLFEMMDLFRILGADKFTELTERYSRVANEIEDGLKKYAIIQNAEGEKRIVHGWGDKRSYLVGSFCDTDNKSRYGLTSYAYWIISGLYKKDPSIRETILKSFDALDSKYGLKTFHPHFEPSTYGVGRLPKLPAGTYENGATYNHATSFAIMALFAMGCPERAWEQINKIVPFTHKSVTTSPFVMPNCYGHNEGKLIDGESVLDWQTGASNVLLKTFIRYVFGFEPTFDGVYIQPAAWSPCGSFEFNILVRGCILHIEYLNSKLEERTYLKNGQIMPGEYDATLDIKKLWISYCEIEKAHHMTVQIND